MIYYIIAGIFIIDRLFKFLVIMNMDLGQKISFLPFLNITYLQNTGMAFSLLSGNNRILLFISIFFCLILAIAIRKSSERDPAFIAYGLILGGALSNLWDRYFYSGVIDYLDFKVWPVFNLGDTAITIGAVLILFQIIKEYFSKAKPSKNVS
ncbi:MAG: signal peptidase II [Elusimicrobiota bacterium]